MIDIIYRNIITFQEESYREYLDVSCIQYIYNSAKLFFLLPQNESVSDKFRTMAFMLFSVAV